MNLPHILDKFEEKIEQSTMSADAKSNLKIIIQKGREIDVESDLVSLVLASVDKLQQPERTVMLDCWKQAQQKQQGKAQKAQAKQKKTDGKDGEQKEDSFKFDSHSESHSSSYDDIDDDFRKEQMQQQEHNT